MIDLSHSRLAPFDHQIKGVEAIVQHPFFLLADEMGAGKTKQAIDAAQVLFTRGVIDKVLVTTPAAVRGVWFHPERGELAKHLWKNIPSRVIEFHRNTDVWLWEWTINGPDRFLEWIVTNYDYIRGNHEEEIIEECTPRTMLILDESSSVKNAQAKQTKAVLRIRQACGRVLLLNGTPIAHSPGDMYSQGRIMHKKILDCGSYTQFKCRYANMGGFEGRQILSWRNLDDLQQRFAPYVLRRLKEDCLDLPPKLPPVTYDCALSPATWKIYTAMRDDLVAWLNDQTVSVAAQAIVKVLRLSQVTSGLLGGLVEEPLDDPQEVPDFLAALDPSFAQPFEPEAPQPFEGPVQFIGREKLDALLERIEHALYEKPDHKFLVWTRFKPEANRTLEEISKAFPQVTARLMIGGQKKQSREATLALLDPKTTVKGPACAVATLGTGSIGLTLTAADTNYYLSLNQMLLHLLQSIDRTHRPTQINPVSYHYFLATGPKGQKTIDHVLYKALMSKDELATKTCSAWVQALRDE